jgi:hypothetical protein
MAREIRFNCWSCKTEILFTDKITRNDFCPECDTPLKCCYNCKFYDKDSFHQCLETQAEWVRYKEKANLCSYFVARPIVEDIPKPVAPKAKARVTARQERNGSRNGKNGAPRSGKDKKKAAWNSLFRDD